LVTNKKLSSPQSISLQEPIEKVSKEKEKEKIESDPNMEVSFWKDK
jgi:hypothetical protein